MSMFGISQLDPGKGNVAFGSGLHGWGFNLELFAQMYEAKFKVKKEKLMKRLWGNNFYSPTERKWSKVPAEGYERGFNMFVMEPVMKVRRLVCIINVSVAKENAQFLLMSDNGISGIQVMLI